jgi:hypothetical protein
LRSTFGGIHVQSAPPEPPIPARHLTLASRHALPPDWCGRLSVVQYLYRRIIFILCHDYRVLPLAVGDVHQGLNGLKHHGSAAQPRNNRHYRRAWSIRHLTHGAHPPPTTFLHCWSTSTAWSTISAGNHSDASSRIPGIPTELSRCIRQSISRLPFGFSPVFQPPVSLFTGRAQAHRPLTHWRTSKPHGRWKDQHQVHDGIEDTLPNVNVSTSHSWPGGFYNTTRTYHCLPCAGLMSLQELLRLQIRLL